MEVGTFICSICGDPSQTICVYCTKDACHNHLCERCHRCSDCCSCELALNQQETVKHPSRNGHWAPETKPAAAQTVAEPVDESPEPIGEDPELNT